MYMVPGGATTEMQRNVQQQQGSGVQTLGRVMKWDGPNGGTRGNLHTANVGDGQMLMSVEQQRTEHKIGGDSFEHSVCRQRDVKVPRSDVNDMKVEILDD